MAKAEGMGQVDAEIGIKTSRYKLTYHIGDIQIPLVELLYQTKQDRWFPFEGTSGKVHVQLEFLYSLSKVLNKTPFFLCVYINL